MRKIAYVVTMVSGLESFVKREIDQLVQNGLSVDVFTIALNRSQGFNPNPACKLVPTNVAASLIGLFYVLFSAPIRFLRLLSEAIRLGGLIEFVVALGWVHAIRQGGYDVIHASFGDRKLFVAYFLSRVCDVPVTTAIHAHEIYAQPNVPLFLRATAHLCGIVTISRKNKELLQCRFGINGDKIDVIPLSIDSEFWQPVEETTVLTVARFTPRKGWDDLFEAARILGPGYRFLAVGFGPMDLNALAQEKGVAGQVTVFPKLNQCQIRVLMNSADVFCLPSKATDDEGSEGIPVVLMEAMSMGLPIVSTDDGSITELVEEVIVPQNAPERLAEALALVAEQTRKGANTHSDVNRQRVLARHHHDNIHDMISFFDRHGQR